MSEGPQGRVYRTHDSLWRWAAYVSAGGGSQNWANRTWTLTGLMVRAWGAEKRVGEPIDWDVRMPARARARWDRWFPPLVAADVDPDPTLPVEADRDHD